MWHPRRTRSWRSLTRTAGILVLLVVYLGTVIGFPLPAARGEGAPVRPCGCGPLDRCQNECCCCRAAPAPAVGTEDTAAPGTYPHCKGSAAKPSRPCCSTSSAFLSSGVRWVAGVAAQKCRGVSNAWVSLGAVLPAPPAHPGLPVEPPSCRVAPLAESLVFHPSAPPLPPPRPSHA
ncbi:MAG TPA: hypothetical protein VKA46_37810 [Gemmataceae bacterium]|nr:hypothetical protein [Gemmataceae bacterium]